MNPPPSLLAPLPADAGGLTVGDVFVLPCSFAQQRLWLVDQMDGGSPAYALTGTVRLRGPLRVDALGRALDEEVRRHEALRTTFGMVDGEPVQVIRPAAPVPLPVVELPAPAGEAGLHRRLREEAERPFDLRQGPLFRAMLLRLGEEEHVLMLMMHHVVTDGWSMGVLFRELSQLYGAFCNGEPSPLPELSIQYADFAGWQREALRGGALDAQLANRTDVAIEIVRRYLPLFGVGFPDVAHHAAAVARAVHVERPLLGQGDGSGELCGIKARFYGSTGGLPLRRPVVSVVAATARYRVLQVRWPVLEGVWGTGLWVEPKGTPVASAVLLPASA